MSAPIWNGSSPAPPRVTAPSGAAHASPLRALRARFLLPVEERPHEIADPAGHGNILAFFVAARDDPEYRTLLAHLMTVYQREVTRLLAEAQHAHELTPGDPTSLAHTLIAATTGELLLWAANPSDSPVISPSLEQSRTPSPAHRKRGARG